MIAYLEHANITVPDIDAAIAFLQTVEPRFKVRHDAKPAGSYRWAHIGTDDTYIALQEPHVGVDPKMFHRTYRNIGVNHLAFVVEDFAAVVERLEAAGYRKGMEGDPHPHRRRVYYFDHVGFEWEIVQYLTDDPAKKNAYD